MLCDGDQSTESTGMSDIELESRQELKQVDGIALSLFHYLALKVPPKC